MHLQRRLPSEDFPTCRNRTGETAGRGPRRAFHLAGHLAGGLADGGSVELLLGPQPLAPVASSESLLLVLLPGHGRGENFGAVETGKPVRTVVLPPAVLVHLSSFDAESFGVVFAVGDEELHTGRDGLADPKML